MLLFLVNANLPKSGWVKGGHGLPSQRSRYPVLFWTGVGVERFSGGDTRDWERKGGRNLDFYYYEVIKIQ